MHAAYTMETSYYSSELGGKVLLGSRYAIGV